MLGAVMIQLVLLHLSGRTDSGDVEIDPNNEYRAIWDAKAHPRDMVSAVGLYSLGQFPAIGWLITISFASNPSKLGPTLARK